MASIMAILASADVAIHDLMRTECTDEERRNDMAVLEITIRELSDIIGD